MCRAVCNPLRLEMMKFIYIDQKDCCVTDIAKLFKVPVAVASIYLNQLCQAGLIGAERDHVKVYFKPWQKGDVPCEFCRVLKDVFEDKRQDWKEYIMTQVKAFSHPNRLAMLLRLISGDATISELKKAAGKCVKTLKHHLLLLNSAGLLSYKRRYHQPMLISLRCDCDPITAVLMGMLSYQSELGMSFYNDTPERGLDSASKTVLRKVAAADGGDWTRIKIQKGKSRRFDRDAMASMYDEDD